MPGEQLAVLVADGGEFDSHSCRLVGLGKAADPRDASLGTQQLRYSRQPELQREHLPLLEQQVAAQESTSGGQVQTLEDELSDAFFRVPAKFDLDCLSYETSSVLIHGQGRHSPWARVSSKMRQRLTARRAGPDHRQFAG